MNKLWVIRGKTLAWIAAAVLLAVLAVWTVLDGIGGGTSATSAAGGNVRTYHMAVVEHTGKTADGKHLEVYRWDPGTLFVNKGETVRLKILGINGSSHPFVIEGTDIRGIVRQGEETEVTFRADKEGIYRLICHTHLDAAHHGPMIGYIVVK